MDIEERIAESVRALQKAGARFVYLFGSRADGTAKPESDVDVAAYFGGPIDLIGVLGKLPDHVDLVVLDDAPLEIAGRVAMRGRLLLEEDPAERVRWEATTRKIYLDEQPRVERARRDFVEGAIRRGRR